MSDAGPELPDEATRPEALVGNVVDGRYRLEAFVGESSTGWVYAAQHVWMPKNLALKLLASDRAQCPQVVARLQREALATCLEKLSKKDRSLVAHRYLEGATTKTVASTVGRSVDAVYKSLQRIRSALLACIRRTLAMEESA